MAAPSAGVRRRYSSSCASVTIRSVQLDAIVDRDLRLLARTQRAVQLPDTVNVVSLVMKSPRSGRYRRSPRQSRDRRRLRRRAVSMVTCLAVGRRRHCRRRSTTRTMIGDAAPSASVGGVVIAPGAGLTYKVGPAGAAVDRDLGRLARSQRAGQLPDTVSVVSLVMKSPAVWPLSSAIADGDRRRTRRQRRVDGDGLAGGRADIAAGIDHPRL